MNKYIVFLILALLSLNSCSSDDQEKQQLIERITFYSNDRIEKVNEFFYNQDQKINKFQSYEVNNSGEIEDLETKIFHYEDQKIIREEDLDENGIPTGIEVKYIYYDDGKFKEKAFYGRTGNLLTRYVYSYANDRIDRMEYHYLILSPNPEEYLYQTSYYLYDDNGNLKSRSDIHEFIGDATDTYTYDDANNPFLNLEPKEAFYSFYLEGENNLLTHYRETESGDITASYEYVYEYDQYNYPITRTDWNHGELNGWSKTYEYYD